MALTLANRVQETATANTTVSFSLAGASTGYTTFSSTVGNTNTTYYGASDGTNWEVGIGTYATTGNLLNRTTILASSNAGSAVTFSGTVTVFIDYPSSKSVYQDASGNVAAPYYIANGAITGTLNAGAFSYGTLPYSDVNIFASYTANQNNYAQIILHNSNSGAAASTDFIVGNNNTTATTFYGDFGINSSAFTGTGSLNAANAVFLSATSTDLVLGTTTSNSIRFVINTGATDAMTINTSGALALNGSFGTAGQVLTTQGSAAVPTWTNSTTSFAGAGASIGTTLTSTGLTSALGVGTYKFTAMIYGQSSSTAGGTFQIAYTGTTTSIDIMQQGQATGTTWVATNRQTAVNTAGTAVWTTATTEMSMLITGVIVTSTAGTFTINATKTTSGTLTIRSGSNLIIG